MSHDQIRARLANVFRGQDLSDSSWLLALDEFDEVPFFTRSDEIEFLAMLPEGQRGQCMFEVALAELDRTAEALDALDGAEHYFLSLTFLDWDLVREGTQVVPTPSLLVSPRWKDELPSFESSAPHSVDARLIERWADRLGRHDLAVGESKHVAEAEPSRVYVGYSKGRHRFRSTGDFPELV